MVTLKTNLNSPHAQSNMWRLTLRHMAHRKQYNPQKHRKGQLHAISLGNVQHTHEQTAQNQNIYDIVSRAYQGSPYCSKSVAYYLGGEYTEKYILHFIDTSTRFVMAQLISSAPSVKQWDITGFTKIEFREEGCHGCHVAEIGGVHEIDLHE